MKINDRETVWICFFYSECPHITRNVTIINRLHVCVSDYEKYSILILLFDGIAYAEYSD